MSRLVVVSNRLPARDKGASAGGLTVAMDAALKTTGGLWLGWSGVAVENPSDEARHTTSGGVTYAALDLSPDEIKGYYDGVANSVLWPLCHYRADLMNYTRSDMEIYRAVNAKFARTLHAMLRPGDVIWVHDYHLIPLASALRAMGVENKIGYFHHIPWPAPDLFRALPRSRQFLSDMLSYDLVGLQTQADARNLRNAIEGARQHLETQAKPRGTVIAAFPISIETKAFAERARRAQNLPRIRELRERFGARDLVIGVDRLDYSKGLPERLRAIEHFLDTNPDMHGRVSMMQITPRSRSGIEGYDRISQEVAEGAGRLNAAYGTLEWLPVFYINRAFSQMLLAGLCRMARVGLVTPLRDGMNLVAKEYVAAQDPDDPGVLILSQFAGAASELTQALIVNPHDIEEVGQALVTALNMPLEERRARHAAMMQTLLGHPIAVWMQEFLGTLTGEAHARPHISGT